jgi:hypothetical protein
LDAIEDPELVASPCWRQTVALEQVVQERSTPHRRGCFSVATRAPEKLQRVPCSLVRETVFDGGESSVATYAIKKRGELVGTTPEIDRGVVVWVAPQLHHRNVDEGDGALRELSVDPACVAPLLVDLGPRELRPHRHADSAARGA